MATDPSNESSIFNAARKIESRDEREAYLNEACRGDNALRDRVGQLLAAYTSESLFLETPAAEHGGTIDFELGDNLAASLDAGLAPAFGEAQAVVIGSANHSVLKSLNETIDSIPHVHLHDAEGEDPIVRPCSPEIPQRDSDSRYQLEGEIARGGMGAILKGRDTDLGRDLAIKVLLDSHRDKPEVIARFIEEAQIGGQLQHPGIAPVYELGQFADKRPFFTMKLVKGKTLAALLTERTMSGVASAPCETDNHAVLTQPRSQDDLPRFLGIFEQVCQTMAYAHNRGVIHRDLKPSNIMVGAFGEVQVMDWGLAKVLSSGGVADEKKARDRQREMSVIRTRRNEGSGDTPEFGSHTQMGSVMGTPAYMPPEQALGEIDQLDQRADVFGLGAILCEILTGKPAYVGENSTQIFRLASRGKLEECFARLENCGADAELISLTKYCLQAEPSDRPNNAAAVTEQITGYLESVQAKLKKAEIEAAEANVRVESQQRQRVLAEQKATSERKRRRVTLVMAVVTFLLFASLGIGGLAAWQQRNMEEIRYSAGIDRVYQLLENYRYEEANANADSLHKTRSFWVPQSIGHRLQETRKDAQLLRDLDRVRQDKAIIVDGKFADPVQAARQYEKVIHDFDTKAGFKRDKGLVPQALLKWIDSRPSVVREQVSAALGDWAVCFAKDKKQSAKRVALLEGITRLEPNSLSSELLQQKVWDDPKKLDERIASLDPTKMSAQLLHSISLKLRATKGDQTAADFLEQVHEHHPTDFWLLFTLANRYEQLKELDLAIGCYRAASAVRPSVSVVYNNWGNVLISKQDYDGAIAKLKKAIEIDPDSANAYSAWGNALSHKKDSDGANAKYKKAAEIDPNYANAYYNWGNTLNENKDGDGAIAKYKKAIAVDPNLAEAYCNWGNILGNQKQDDDGAIEKYKKAAAINPKLVQAYTGWGNALSRKQDSEGAIAKFKQAIEIDPNDARTYTGWGNALSRKQDHDGAIAKFKKATEIDPKNVKAYNDWAIALDGKKDYEGAIAKYQKANELDPDDAKIYLNWGYALYHKKDYDGAIAKYQKAIELDPNDAYVYTNWGIVLYDKEDYDGAIAKYKKAIELDPKEAVAYNNWGNVLTHQKKHSEAIAKFKTAVSLDPDFAEAYGNWGKVLANKQDYDGASVKYEKATGINPKSAHVYNRWGAMLCDRVKDYDGAIAKFEKAVSLDPDLADAHYNWGNALSGKRDWDGAIAKFKKATSLNPNKAEAFCNWGIALLEQMKYSEAISKFEKANATNPKIIQVYYGWGNALFHTNDYKGAIAKYNLALTHTPNHAEANCNLGHALKTQGQFESALNYYRLGHTLGTKRGSAWRYPSAIWVQQCEQLVNLDKQLTSIIKSQPNNPKQLLLFVVFCKNFKKQDPAAMKLVKTIEGRFPTVKTWKGTLSTKQKEQTHPQKLEADKTYLIEMQSNQFDTYLRLKDAKGKMLGENDDIAPNDLNSRIIFTAKQDGTCDIVATSFQQQGRGSYTITVREFQTSK